MQNVHWYCLGLSSKSSFGVRVGRRRRRRLSLDLRLLKEPSEWRELCEWAELYEPKEPEETPVRPVSSDVVDGARNTEKLPVLLEFSLR